MTGREVTMRERLLEFLGEERDGCHNESERRVVADFVLEAVAGDPDGPSAIDLCGSLELAARELKERLAAKLATW